MPPEATSCWLYAAPTMPPATVVVPIVRDELTVSVSACVAVRDAASVTRTVKLALPAAVGVPLMTPDVLSPRPAGSDPEASVQL